MSNDTPIGMTQRLSEAVAALGPRQRMVIAGAVLMGIVGLGLVGHSMKGEPPVALFNGLAYEDVAKITERLDAQGIAYQLGAGGTAVLVDTKDAARARVGLASTGLPASGRPGFELFDKTHWGMSDFAQKINYKRALEGELERTLSKMQGIKRAKVHITLPEKSPFLQQERDAEASVVLSTAAGANLDKEAVRAITMMVAGSVERLAPTSVTVVNESGRLLSAADDGSLAGVGERQISMRQEYERHLSDKVRAMIGDIVGAQNVRVEVSAQLDFDRVQRQIESFDPDRQVILSEQESEREAGDPPATIGSASTKTTNYENSHTIERVDAAVGGVRSLSIAVLVNERKTVAGADTVSQPLSADELSRLERLVIGATGVDERRGDRVVVASFRFEETPSLETPEEVVPWYTLASRYAIPGVGLIGFLLAFFLLRSALGAGRTTKSQPETRTIYLRADGSPMEAKKEEEEEDEGLLGEVRSQVMENPEVAARLVQKWIRNN